MKKLVILLNIASIFARKKKSKFSYLKELDKSYVTVNGYMAAYQKLVSVRYPALSNIVDDIKNAYGKFPCIEYDRIKDFYASMSMTKKRNPNIFFVSNFSQIYICIVSFSKREDGTKTIIEVSDRLLLLGDALIEFKGKVLGPDSAIYVPAEYKWR